MTLTGVRRWGLAAPESAFASAAGSHARYALRRRLVYEESHNLDRWIGIRPDRKLRCPGAGMIDTQRLNADTDEVEKYCFKNPDAPLMPSVETIVGPRN